MKLTKRDETKLKNVHPDLIKFVRRAAEVSPIPFMIMEGCRSIEQQRKNIKNGVSWTMRSRHIASSNKNGCCCAVDLVPLVEGKISWAWPVYRKMAPELKKVAKELKLPVDWGGDWKKTPDGPHWELNWKKYP